MNRRGLPSNVWIVTATSFLTDISSEMLVHMLPLFLANILGVRTSVIGLIEGIAETTASLLKVFSGWLSDRLGDRKWLAVGGYSLSTLAKPFLLVSTPAGALSDSIGRRKVIGGGWLAYASIYLGFGPAAPFLFGAAMALGAVLLLLRWLPSSLEGP